MKFNIKDINNAQLSAAKKTCVQMVVFLALVWLAVYLSQFLTIKAFVWIVTITLIGIFAYILYTINLDAAAFRQKYTEKSKS